MTMDHVPMSGWAKLDMLLHAAVTQISLPISDDRIPLPPGAIWAWEVPVKIDLSRHKIRHWDQAKRST